MERIDADFLLQEETRDVEPSVEGNADDRGALCEPPGVLDREAGARIEGDAEEARDDARAAEALLGGVAKLLGVGGEDDGASSAPHSAQQHFDRPWLPGETRATRLVVIGKRGLDRVAIAAGLGTALALVGG